VGLQELSEATDPEAIESGTKLFEYLRTCISDHYLDFAKLAELLDLLCIPMEGAQLDNAHFDALKEKSHGKDVLGIRYPLDLDKASRKIMKIPRSCLVLTSEYFDTPLSSDLILFSKSLKWVWIAYYLDYWYVFGDQDFLEAVSGKSFLTSYSIESYNFRYNSLQDERVDAIMKRLDGHVLRKLISSDYQRNRRS